MMNNPKLNKFNQKICTLKKLCMGCPFKYDYLNHRKEESCFNGFLRAKRRYRRKEVKNYV